MSHHCVKENVNLGLGIWEATLLSLYSSYCGADTTLSG